MPPKRGSSRRGGSVIRQPGPVETLDDLNVSNQNSPQTRSRQPFAYGRGNTPELPRQLRLHPSTNRAPMTKSIDDSEGIYEHTSDDRAMNMSSHRRIGSASVSPVRSPLARHATPDQQLLQSLEASVSPSPRKRRVEVEQDPSTTTPSPPVQHTISTTPTPSAPAMTSYEADDASSPQRKHRPSSSLYPLVSQGLRSSSILNSPGEGDNESTISWAVERRVHDGEIQRTRSPRHRQDSKGKNITAPPRRLSGLTFLKDTIDEQSEPASPVHNAPARTVISSRTVPTHAYQDSTVVDEIYASEDLTGGRMSSGLRSAIPAWIRTRNKNSITFALIVALVAIMAYAFSDKLAAAAHSISSIPLKTHTPYSNLNSSNGEAVNYLAGEVDRLVQHLSTMSKDMSSLKSNAGKVIDYPTAVRPADPEATPHVNFLSVGTGLSVDLRLTSPTVGRKPSFLQKLHSYATLRRTTHENSPITALLPWDGIGDCWCSAPRPDGSSQIAVQLGSRVVPEAIAVEHIPKFESLDPGVTPREMELWAQYRPTSFSSADDSSHSSYAQSYSSTHDSILETIRLTYPNEPETSYWNDPLLGPSFFRISRWQYDVDGPSVQVFGLDAVIDVPGFRVDKVVVRIKSNWGGPHTCLYRLRLYGHL